MNTAKVVNYVTKGVGVVGALAVLYDAHTLGKIQSSTHQKKVSANIGARAVENTLTQSNPSIIQSKIKKGTSNFLMEERLSGFFTGIGGYLRGFGKMLVNDVVPLGLAVGTLAFKNATASRVCGAGLLAYGLAFVLRDVFGFLKPKELTRSF